jgi:hypothetical protein
MHIIEMDFLNHFKNVKSFKQNSLKANAGTNATNLNVE